jgi:hypothetical protein
MKILKHLFLPLLATFCVSALPLSSAFAAEEEKRHQDARGLDNRRSEQSLPGRLTVAKFLTPSGILQPLTKLSAALTGAISGLLKTMRDQGPPFTIYGPLPDKDLLIRLPVHLLAEIGEFLSPKDFTHYCLLLKKAGHSEKIPRRALSLRLTTSEIWLDHHLPELSCIPELTIWHDASSTIGDEDIGHYTRSLPHIKKMDLGCFFSSKTVLTDGGLKHIGTLAKLQELILRYHNGVTDEGLKHIGTLAKLKKLELGFLSKVTGVGFQHLRGLLALQRLQLASMALKDADIQHLSGLRALRQLELDDMDGITDAGLQHLSGLSALESLQLKSLQRMTDEGIQHLSGLTALRQLELVFMDEITDASLQHLSGLALESLELNSLKRVTDGGIQPLSGIPALRQLKLMFMDGITGTGLQHLSGLPALRQLELLYMDKITDAGLQHLHGLQALRHLTLGYMDKITDTGLEHLRGLPALESLELKYLEGVTDRGILQLNGLLALRHLELIGIKKVTGAGLQRLSPPVLKNLMLCGLEGVTSMPLLEGLPTLRELTLEFAFSEFKLIAADLRLTAADLRRLMRLRQLQHITLRAPGIFQDLHRVVA